MKIEVYSKDGCPYCVRAKNLLSIKGMNYTEFRLGENGVDKDFIQKKAGKSVNTVPQIFINDQHIGGFTDLEKYLKEARWVPHLSPVYVFLLL